MNPQEKAADLLIFYMRNAWEAAGKNWMGDNDSEVRAVVDLIVDACKAYDGSKAQQMRYVGGDGGRYTEWNVTVVPTVAGQAVVYEGANGTYGPVFDGPHWQAINYARDRDTDLTAKGYVAVKENQR